MIFGSRSIADDAEADERHFIQIANLCNGTRFHIYCQSVGEVLLYGIKLASVGNKLIAATNQAAVYGSSSVERHGTVIQRFISAKESRKSLNLSVSVAFATPYIVIYNLCAGYHVHHLKTSIYSACHAGTNHTVGGKVTNQFYGSCSRVNLTYATLHQNHVVIVYSSFYIAERTFCTFCFIFKLISQLLLL